MKRGLLILNRCQMKTYQVFRCKKLRHQNLSWYLPPKCGSSDQWRRICKETWTMKILHNICTQANYFIHKYKCHTWCTVPYRSDRWQRLPICVHCSLKSYSNGTPPKDPTTLLKFKETVFARRHSFILT